MASVPEDVNEVQEDEEEVRWALSPARALLRADLLAGRISMDGSVHRPAYVYGTRPEYSDTNRGKFARRLRALRSQLTVQMNRADVDYHAFVNDLPIIRAARREGVPRWMGSEAEKYLRHDVLNGRHNSMEPHELFQSREEYLEFEDYNIFRKHIHQEVGLQKMYRQRFPETYDKMVADFQTLPFPTDTSSF